MNKSKISNMDQEENVCSKLLADYEWHAQVPKARLCHLLGMTLALERLAKHEDKAQAMVRHLDFSIIFNLKHYLLCMPKHMFILVCVESLFRLNFG